MTEQELFEAAIRADPADATLRLVFSDWLESCGHEDAAYEQRTIARAISLMSPKSKATIFARLMEANEDRTVHIKSEYQMACAVEMTATSRLNHCLCGGKENFEQVTDGTWVLAVLKHDGTVAVDAEKISPIPTSNDLRTINNAYPSRTAEWAESR